ncbi:hypothetical protein T440DRAFT_496772 [Plenodomus tracheiphilus IPT5]|uniref:Uncharacterized protein n=1 Tax=Plenodomus tracheiphilus IPT5 TaxID=1408161 RepID=A0A6A7BHK4_9PLEO|nr:hypothetical protein T440DRAFT_496772 [Plenodomus tracheiphilus IPT5]
MADKTPKGSAAGWTEHEVLVYVLSGMEHSHFKIDYNNAPIPAGRNANGIRQKINKMLIALKPELDALKAGQPLPTTEATPKKTPTPRKRKGKGDDAGDGDGSPKKRGRPKKSVTPKDEVDEEDIPVKKEEVQDEEQLVEDEV